MNLGSIMCEVRSGGKYVCREIPGKDQVMQMSIVLKKQYFAKSLSIEEKLEGYETRIRIVSQASITLVQVEASTSKLSA